MPLDQYYSSGVEVIYPSQMMNPHHFSEPEWNPASLVCLFFRLNLIFVSWNTGTFAPTRLRQLTILISSSHPATNIDHTSIASSSILAAEKQSQYIWTKRGGSTFHRESFPHKERRVCTPNVLYVTATGPIYQGTQFVLRRRLLSTKPEPFARPARTSANSPRSCWSPTNADP